MFRNFFIFFFLCTSLFAEKTDLLFYIQDAGESFALMPVMKELDKRGVPYLVLAAGAASDLVKKGGIPSERIRSFQTSVDKNWERGQLLSSEEISKLVQQIEPIVVVTGVAFELQGQVLKAYQEMGAKTCAYWDNFNADGENLYFSTAHLVERCADLLLLPSQHLAESQEFAHRKDSEKIVVGQPSLEEWERDAYQIDLGMIRGKLGICPCQKVALYVGGYGEDYNEAFRLFLESVESLKRNEYRFLIQTHPKFGGAAEREILSQHPSKLPIRLLQGEITTSEAVALADLVVCHQSTVGFQALALGKRVVYLIPAAQTFDSLPLQKGLAKRVSYPADFESALKDSKFGGEFYQLLGIPHQSVPILVQALEELCRASEK